ncbi:MAG: type IV toxin-antitoxin system AbiEi family antitoxin domain-containing protein [Pseudomonadota bacterium]
MRTIKKLNKLRGLLKRPLFRSSEAKKLGISSGLLSYYTQKGLIERVDRGVYRGKESVLNVDFKWEDLVLAAKSIPDGVVCLISALALYELTEEIPRAHWIAVANTTRAPKRKGVKIVRMRNIHLGQTEAKVGNEKIKIFNQERTIVDVFRYLGKETAIKVLRAALTKKAEEKIDLKRLQDYAKKLRVRIDTYILAVTT